MWADMRILVVAVGILAASLFGGCATTEKEPASDSATRTPAEVNTQLGIAYMREGMYEASLDKFNKALAQDPRLAIAHASLAVLYERLGEIDLADKHYVKAYRLDADDPIILNNYGQYLCRKGRLEEADRMFLKALRDPLYRFPETILTNAGLCAQQRPDLELAEKYFRQALEKNPSFQPALRQMVRNTFAQQQFLATRAYLQRLQERGPLTAEFLWIGVRAESQLGDRDAASSYALLLKNEFPESMQTQALIEWEHTRRGQ
jgi:type IV pilus assembly protein PilF